MMLKNLKPWRLTILLIAIVITVGALYFFYANSINQDGSNEEKDVRNIPVRYGDIKNEISVSGTLKPAVKESLYFSTSGKVKNIYVEEGEKVNKGSTLARLDNETIANLSEKVAEDEIAVRNAREALESIKNPDINLSLANLNKNLAAANLDLSEAKESLKLLQNPSASTIAQLNLNISESKSFLNQKQSELDDMVSNYETNIAIAKRNVIQSEIALDNASTSLFSISNKEDLIEEYLEAIQSAQTHLTNAENNLISNEINWDTNIANAQTTYDQALEDYKESMIAWLGVDIDVKDSTTLEQNPIDLIESWGVTLSEVYSGTSETYVGSDDPTTPWNEKTVNQWVRLYPTIAMIQTQLYSYANNPFPNCTQTNKESLSECVKNKIEPLWINLDAASTQLKQTTLNRDTNLASLNSSILNATNNLSEAQQNYDEITAPTEQIIIDNLTIEKEIAELNLKVANTNYIDALNGTDIVELHKLQHTIKLANISVEEAEENLFDVLNPNTLELELRKTQVNLAEVNVVEIQQNIDALNEEVDPLEIEAQQTTLDKLMAKLEQDRTNLLNATIVAPFDGIISVINIEEGKAINNQNSPAMEIVDPSILQLDGNVPEIDILSVTEGAKANINIDALPGQLLTGKVTHISYLPITVQGVVNYPIEIEVTLGENTEIRDGLTAIGTVSIQEVLNVLVVPIDS
ncbi:MAG: hypothetical protein CL768_02425, partial [Chloroflexi bacterium]|nr:hypothetical protein [Chloroflexota bacterium]